MITLLYISLSLRNWRVGGCFAVSRAVGDIFVFAKLSPDSARYISSGPAVCLMFRGFVWNFGNAGARRTWRINRRTQRAKEAPLHRADEAHRKLLGDAGAPGIPRAKNRDGTLHRPFGIHPQSSKFTKCDIYGPRVLNIAIKFQIVTNITRSSQASKKQLKLE